MLVGSQRAERHREAALSPSAPPERRHVLELREFVRAEGAEFCDADAVSGTFESADRLAHLANRPPLERETVRLHDCLVPDVEGAKPGLPVQGQQLLADSDRG